MRPDVRTLVYGSFRIGNAGVHVRRITNHDDNPPHDHVFHELVFIEAGAAEHHAADGARKLRPGDVIVLRPQVWHAYAASRGLCLVNCLIDAPLMQRLYPLLGPAPGLVDLFQKRDPRPADAAPVVLHASAAQRAAFRDRLDAMMLEQRERRTGWDAVNTAAVLELLVGVLRLHENARPASPTPPRTDRVEHAVLETASHLEQRFTDSVSLAALAQRVHLSPGHLSRSFSRLMGMGIVDYLHRIRAEEACRLLRCTDLPVGHIASRVGYTEVAYFSRCFRRQIGTSPRQYRQTPAVE